jgi:predicted nucleotide-binding protein
MLSRFQGKEGMRRLITALMKQDIVENNRALAAQIARLGVLECVQAETNFIVQDAKDNDIFFIVSGQADIFVNDKRLRSRKDGECVGEMAAIDPAKPRAATVRARTELVYVRLSEPCFRTLSNRYPKMWSPIAKTLGDRLRQRNGFHKVPNPKPIVFIGSSTESSPLADAIKAAFLPDEVKVLVWTQDVFGPSSMTLDTLLEHAREVDFAAFIFSPDDKVTSRRKSKMGPRDNVIFELGLFMDVRHRWAGGR